MFSGISERRSRGGRAASSAAAPSFASPVVPPVLPHDTPVTAIEDDEDEMAVLEDLERQLWEAQASQRELEKEADLAAVALARNVEATQDKAKAAADAAAASVERDERSVFVGNVDFRATATEVGEFFGTCGAVRAVKILLDKYSGRPRGQAYVEFATRDGVENAVVLDGATFKDRQLSVARKRTLVPRGARGGHAPRRAAHPSRGGGGSHRGGSSWGRPRGRGRGSSRGRGRGRGRGGFRGRGRGSF